MAFELDIENKSKNYLDENWGQPPFLVIGVKNWGQILGSDIGVSHYF